MDLLAIIREKSKAFANSEFYEGIEAVILHIEVAEYHYERGKAAEYFYTDVIYRANQAFEGALKEAYRVFTGKNPSGISPYKIEQYLEEKRVLKERVLAQFTNYRTEWRNKSTHDYQLEFSSQEALLAIVSISAFFSILLDQMLEKHSHDLEKRKLRERSYSLVRQVQNYNELDFVDQCVELLRHFATDLAQDKRSVTEISEYEILGKLSGFIAASDPEMVATPEKTIRTESQRLVVDLFLEKHNRSLIVELKRPSVEWRRRVREGLEQIKLYLAATGCDQGIIFIPSRSGESLSVEKTRFELNNRTVQVVIVGPRTKPT